MLRTSFTDPMAIDVPVVSAPLAGVSGGTLAAVTAGGGLGMTGAGSTTPPEWILAEDELAAADGAREELATARKRGDYDIAYRYAGQGVGLVSEERPAAGVVARLAAGAERLLRRWG